MPLRTFHKYEGSSVQRLISLAREPTLTGGTADNVQDLISPRIWKLGVRVSWK